MKGPKMPPLASRLGEGVTNGPPRGGKMWGDGGETGDNQAKEEVFFV